MARVASVDPESTTTTRGAQRSDSRVRPRFGSSLYVRMNGVTERGTPSPVAQTLRRIQGTRAMWDNVVSESLELLTKN